MNWSAWLRQPTTITGLAACAATGAAAGVYAATRSPADAGLAAGAVFSLLHVAIDDNSALPRDVAQLAIDAATAAASRRIAGAAPGLFADGLAVARDVAAVSQPHS